MSDDYLAKSAREAFAADNTRKESEEIARLTRLRADIAALTAERDRMREALRDCVSALKHPIRPMNNDGSLLNNIKFEVGRDMAVNAALRRARAALEGVTEPASPWRDIESAPKDGTEIIGVVFIDYKSGVKPFRLGPWTIAWSERAWRPSWNENLVLESQTDFGSEFQQLDLQPTHWMPLPEPPR